MKGGKPGVWLLCLYHRGARKCSHGHVAEMVKDFDRFPNPGIVLDRSLMLGYGKRRIQNVCTFIFARLLVFESEEILKYHLLNAPTSNVLFVSPILSL